MGWFGFITDTSQIQTMWDSYYLCTFGGACVLMHNWKNMREERDKKKKVIKVLLIEYKCYFIRDKRVYKIRKCIFLWDRLKWK